MFNVFRELIYRAIVLVFFVTTFATAAVGVEPLPHAHAHNDYWQKRPLLDALDQGFTSVEADIYLLDGKLLVGHDRKELSAERDLESLYLKPLAERAQRFQGHVYPNGERFYLLVDIKTDAQPTCAALASLLSQYRESLTLREHRQVRPGAIQVIVTGNRPPLDADDGHLPYFAWDGRLSDLGSSAPAERMPMISDNWQSHFKWRGDGEMPTAERERLRQIVEQAHSSGRVLRFWATPEREAVWSELRAAGVDLIGTDQLERLGKYLRGKEDAPTASKL